MAISSLQILNADETSNWLVRNYVKVSVAWELIFRLLRIVYG